ncbi:uncharacterized protein BO96DRAFT_399841 [Aspergillus niger CBS 101883]|uniref:Contig An07c0240, genomic contig n=2 Tax=Aspergillus niger TaxID=5061 RepID=A2QP42_ASPNC|nr:uncharacterized protein BO96DRAFT_399841 [Aspergillus niger CBS 101883]XP_059601041.1 uncharacterized protein An07g08130 [Aspergillus niger]PYH53381.1 hypothetical protein BO96DRAFT_399841 [Aspergillus niger CBS 101883]CAK39629.1 unnamed protein product [Aspergillus niger]
MAKAIGLKRRGHLATESPDYGRSRCAWGLAGDEKVDAEYTPPSWILWLHEIAFKLAAFSNCGRLQLVEQQRHSHYTTTWAGCTVSKCIARPKIQREYRSK